RTEGELALGNTVFVQAYRLAGLIPGSLGMILAGFLPWEVVFPVMGAFVAVGIVLTLLIREAQAQPEIPASLKAAITEPFREFFGRRGYRAGLTVLAFMFLYKLGDNMATVLSTPFYIDLGFTTTQIGLIAKNAALWPSIVGGVLGGLIIVKIGINRGLWIFGAVQLVTIFGFVWLSIAGAEPWILAVVIGAEYLGVGLGTSASVAFIARETARTAVATQFALFTALAALPRVLASSVSGLIVDAIGWTDFFYLCALLAVPGMLLLYWVAPFNAPVNAAANPTAGSGSGPDGTGRRPAEGP
ncbi:MAG TPA: MFS transporter, partial [Pseudomonadales bacterium]